MNAVKPPVRACSSRTRRRCSIRSASVSPRPYIMVTEVFMPCRCASSCTSSHSRSAPSSWRRARGRVHQDLAAAAGNAVEPRRRAARGPRPARVSPKRSLKKTTSRGREAVDVDRVVALDVAHQVEVPLERDVRIVPALHQDLDAADRLALVDLGADLLEGQDVALGVLRPAVERAELAVGDADVGVVDVAVDDVGDDVLGVLPPALGVGQPAQLEERGALVELEVGPEFT